MVLNVVPPKSMVASQSTNPRLRLVGDGAMDEMTSILDSLCTLLLPKSHACLGIAPNFM